MIDILNVFLGRSAWFSVEPVWKCDQKNDFTVFSNIFCRCWFVWFSLVFSTEFRCFDSPLRQGSWFSRIFSVVRFLLCLLIFIMFSAILTYKCWSSIFHEFVVRRHYCTYVTVEEIVTRREIYVKRDLLLFTIVGFWIKQKTSDSSCTISIVFLFHLIIACFKFRRKPIPKSRKHNVENQKFSFLIRTNLPVRKFCQSLTHQILKRTSGRT